MRVLAEAAALLLAAAWLGACSQRPQGYFPLGKGLWWEYRLSMSTARGSSEGRYLVRNLGARALHGETALVREVHDGSLYFYARRADGIYRLASQRQGARPRPGTSVPQLVLPIPAVLGAAWTAPGTTSVLARPIGAYEKKLVDIVVSVPMVYTVQATNAEVRVPAGRFGRCLRIHAKGQREVDLGGVIGKTRIAVENTDWFAPGVGLIRTVHRESTASARLPGGRFVLELEAYGAH